MLLRRVLVAWLLSTGSLLLAQEKSISICVAPYAVDKPEHCAAPPALCAGGKLEFQIDNEKRVACPSKWSMPMQIPADTEKHRITVYRSGKPQQSFRFRPADYKSMRLCLFINDFYQTVQLWDRAHSPWCRCG